MALSSSLPHDVELCSRSAAISLSPLKTLWPSRNRRPETKPPKSKLYLEEEIRSEFTFEEIVSARVPLLERAPGSVVARRTLTALSFLLLRLTWHRQGGSSPAPAIILSAPRCATFCKIKCGRPFPASFFESELFVHERGAFTSRHQKIGRFELCRRGKRSS